MQLKMPLPDTEATNQHRLFLTRLSKIKDKMEQELKPIKISQPEADKLAPKGGKRLLREQRSKLADLSTQNPSMSAMNVYNSKSDLSNAANMTSYAQLAATKAGQQSNATLINPKTVREWALKNDLTRTLTDGNITWSLMQKAKGKAGDAITESKD